MLNKMDFLSPSTTLFYFEKRSHTSKIGGFLVLLMVSLDLAYAIYISYITINHKKATTIFYKKFEWEAGNLNYSSIFNFIQLFSSVKGGEVGEYNSKYIYTYMTYANLDFKESSLNDYDHWVFDKCRKEFDEKYINSYLLSNINNFTNSACIRYYYNSQKNNYYSIEEEGFIWPHLEHGSVRRDNVYLTTTIQKCSNNSVINKLFGKCPTDEEINKYINEFFSIYFYFIDRQINPLDFDNPIQQLLNTVTCIIGTEQSYIENYLYFAPLKIISDFGQLISDKYEINSHYFDSNIKISKFNSEKTFKLAKYYYLMQNNVHIYERRYNNILDILSQIGGGIQLLFYVFFWINFLYNKFIITADTNSLFFHARDTTNHPINFNKYLSYNFKKEDEKSKNESEKKGKNNNNNTQNIYNHGVIKINLVENNINQDKISRNSSKKSKNSDLSKISSEKSNEKSSVSNSKNNSINNYSNKNLKNNSSYNYSNKNLNNNSNYNNPNSYINYILNYKKKASNNLSINNSINQNKEEMDKSNGNLILNDILKYKRRNNIYGNKLSLPKIMGPKDSIFSIFENQKDICELPQYQQMKEYRISRKSVHKINRQKTICENLIKEEKLKIVKNLTFFLYIKSLCFTRYKGTTDFTTRFRKNLLSEEHLFKSHIKSSLLEKQYKLSTEQTVSFIDIFNNL